MQHTHNVNVPAIPPGELKNRVARVQEELVRRQADACVVTTGVNLFYLAGFVFDGFLYIAPGDDPVLFVKRPVDVQGERVQIIRKPEQIGGLLAGYGLATPRRVWLESDVVSYNTLMRLQAALGATEIAGASSVLRGMRMLKSDYELSLIRESARLQSLVYAQIPSVFEPGMSDIDFQIEMERLLRKSGSLGIFRTYGENMEIFMGSVLAGDNAGAASPYDFALGGRGLSPALPLGANGTLLEPGVTLMVDMCGAFTPYQSDMTRSFAIGNVPPIAHQAHKTSLDIHAAILSFAKAGTPCADLYRAAHELTLANGLEDYFMGTAQQAKFIGHGVGLEINEPPVLTPKSTEVLLPGMVIAIEPKYVLPGIGAAGMENTYIVCEEGLEKITICEEGLVRL